MDSILYSARGSCASWESTRARSIERSGEEIFALRKCGADAETSSVSQRQSFGDCRRSGYPDGAAGCRRARAAPHRGFCFPR